jgi:F-type H+-transporting ATPase subunit epsilon
MTLTVRVIAPDKIVWDDKAEEIILPSTTGQLGILTNHAPLLTALGMGVMRIRDGKNWKAIALLGGFAEVENNEVKILVNGAELGDNIDKAQAGAVFEEAQRKLDTATQSGDRQKQIQAENALKRARVRYQAAGGVVAL